MTTGIGSHQSHKMLKDEWLTPPDLMSKLGEFDLDPCSPAIRPWDTAKKHYCLEDDGLNKEWEGALFITFEGEFGKVTKKVIKL